MRSRHALLLLVLSAALLAATGAAWWAARDAPVRADLVGPTVTTAPPISTTTAPPPTTTTTVAPVLPASEPGRLSIPDLGVDAPVVPVGLEPDGSMEVPGASQAGWYEPGAAPGSGVGSAVIAAHVDFGGERGVFFELRRVALGAEVVVEDERGEDHRYRIVERTQFDKDALPIPELFRPTGPAVLTLITCGGAFDRGARSYADNIVVRAVPV